MCNSHLNFCFLAKYELFLSLNQFSLRNKFGFSPEFNCLFCSPVRTHEFKNLISYLPFLWHIRSNFFKNILPEQRLNVLAHEHCQKSFAVRKSGERFPDLNVSEGVSRGERDHGEDGEEEVEPPKSEKCKKNEDGGNVEHLGSISINISYISTECVTKLDLQSRMIIFESILTTFEASVIFSGRWCSSKNWLELKTWPPKASLTNLSLSKSFIRTVDSFKHSATT